MPLAFGGISICYGTVFIFFILSNPSYELVLRVFNMERIWRLMIIRLMLQNRLIGRKDMQLSITIVAIRLVLLHLPKGIRFRD